MSPIKGCGLTFDGWWLSAFTSWQLLTIGLALDCPEASVSSLALIFKKN